MGSRNQCIRGFHMVICHSLYYSRAGLSGADAGSGLRGRAARILGADPNRHAAGASNTVSNEAESAGYIAATVGAFVVAALKLRSIWSGDSRKITHDENASKWEASILQENTELRAQIVERDRRIDASWQKHLDDVQRITQLEGDVVRLHEEIGRLQTTVAQMGGKIP